MYIDPCSWAVCEFGVCEQDVLGRLEKCREALRTRVHKHRIFQKRDNCCDNLVSCIKEYVQTYIQDRPHGPHGIIIKFVDVSYENGKLIMDFGCTDPTLNGHWTIKETAREVFRMLVDSARRT